MHGLGFNRFAAKYLSAVKVDAAGTLPSVTTPWVINKFVSDYYADFRRTPGIAYPFIGGNEAAHAIDLFGNYNLEFVGTFTHSSTGVLSDGSTGYATVKGASVADIFPDAHNWSFGFYSRTNLASDTKGEIGSTLGTSKMAINPRNVAGNCQAYVGTSTQYTGAVTSTLGLFQARRYLIPPTPASVHVWHNGVAKISQAVAASGIPGSWAFCHANAWLWSGRQQAFAFAAPTYSTGSSAFYTLIQNLQTHCGRQV